MREHAGGSSGQEGDPQPPHERRVHIGHALLRERLIIDEQLGGRVFANPHWDMLLELYLAELAQKLVYQSYLAAGAPPASAHRRSARLEEKGFVSRTIDPTDHRRVIVTLNPKTRAALDRIMDLVGVTFALL